LLGRALSSVANQSQGYVSCSFVRKGASSSRFGSREKPALQWGQDWNRFHHQACVYPCEFKKIVHSGNGESSISVGCAAPVPTVDHSAFCSFAASALIFSMLRGLRVV
jgi:hypothetical protein